MIWEYIRRAWRLEDHVERSPRNQFRWCNKEGRKQRCVTCTESHEENLNGALHVNETRLSFCLVFWERGWLEIRAGLKSSSKPLTVLECTIVSLISVSWTHSCLPFILPTEHLFSPETRLCVYPSLTPSLVCSFQVLAKQSESSNSSMIIF